MVTTPTIDASVIDALAGVLARARSLLFVTGAGMSADSGLPTYRGVGGLYDDGDAEVGLPIEEVLSGDMFDRRPELTWKHIHRIEVACRGARPNLGHEILAGLEARFERVLVVTQNVDGFHRAAGSKNVVELHGDVHQLRCTRCAWRERVADYADLTLPPRCPACRAIVRPDVVLFGETLPTAPFARLEADLARGFDVSFAIGTSALFPYIARPILLARAAGRATVEINPGSTELSDVVDYRIQAGARVALAALWTRLGY